MIDTHCHLYMADYFPDPARVVDEAAQAGVHQMVVIGIDSETSRQAVELADRFPEVYATVGWHPTNAATYTSAELRVLEELVGHEKVVAVGEIGYDFYWDKATPEEQDVCFAEQYEFAMSVQKPLIFHCREAYAYQIERLERLPPHPFVFHCFAGDAAQAQWTFDRGGYIGVDGPITYPKSQDLRDLIQSAPRDRVLIETDAPFLSPQKFRGKTNQPAYVRFVNQMVSNLWDVHPDEGERILDGNARRFFGI
ncbi:MAG: TatD family hydrolase [Chthonomonas sp.]|nr:TatD family hydrolase [Chthonomonas sp.]